MTPAQLRRATAATAALAAVVIAWAALPLAAGRAGTKLAFIAAIVTAVLSIAQLAASGVAHRQDLWILPQRTVESLVGLFRAAPWPEGMVLSVLALEALHRARPWHTGVLGVALLAFLFAMHIAETSADPGVLRPQLALIAAGLGLLALAVGAAALPGSPSGPGSALIRMCAIVAAVVVAAMTVPGTGITRR
jgi:hypothetical protein